MRHGHRITGAVFSSDGKSIIASDFESGVHVWDVAEGKEVRRFIRNAPYCRGLALSPDGGTLAVAFDNLTVTLYDPSSGRELGSLPKDSNDISQLVFSNDGSLLAIRGSGKSVRIWEVATRRLIHESWRAAWSLAPVVSGTLPGARKSVNSKADRKGRLLSL
jgi:WD40 repeat protein